ncbi:MAG: DNA replication/repair protein RecF [Kurthia sp.]
MKIESQETKDLKITDLSLSCFRNYSSFELHNIESLTIFVGHNAIGKTNIVEGIQLLTALTSFRNPTGKQLIAWNKEAAHLSISVKNKSRDLKLKLTIQEGKRAYFLNGKPKRIQTLKGLVPSVTFTPDDLALVKGSQSGKRSALDTLGSQLSQNYYVIKKDYEKILQHKNRLLKDEGSEAFFDSIDETLLTVGTQLYCYRSAMFKKLLVWIEYYYKEITGGKESVGGAYIPSWIDGEDVRDNLIVGKDEAYEMMRASLDSLKDEERRRKRSLVGPHADKIEFYIHDKNARTYASQGQQRSIVLSFKLAELALIREMLDQKPILLLDDVMSELDESRRDALMGFITGDIQTFITTTNLHYFSENILNRARIVRLESDEQTLNPECEVPCHHE